MGYTTEFEGKITIDPPLNAIEMTYLNKFSETRRMDREQGPYYVDGGGFCGQDSGGDVFDYNSPPVGQPGLWCKWVPTEDGSALEWNGVEKFYDSVEWMQYIIDHFIGDNPLAKGKLDFLQAHKLQGHITAQGEEYSDRWILQVMDNKAINVSNEPKGRIVCCPHCDESFVLEEE